MLPITKTGKFIHYLIDENGLRHPTDVLEINSGGEFYIPVNKDGKPYPSKFHFTIYHGMGRHSKIKTGSIEILSPETIKFCFGEHEVPGDELPEFNVIGKSTYYCGDIKHPDFNLPFRRIEPTDPQILDRLLDDHGISIMGCQYDFMQNTNV